MIMFFRKFSETKIGKLLVFLIALSMVGYFGLGQITSVWGVSSTDAIRVGNRVVKPYELVRDVEKQARQMTTITGKYVSFQDLIAEGFLPQIVASKIEAFLSDITAQELGLVASSDAVANYIVNNPKFQTITGAYDPAVMRAYLNHVQMSEQELISSLRKELAHQHLAAAIHDVIAVPSAMQDALYVYKNETRNFETILLPYTSVPVKEKPSQEELKEYYDAMSDSLYDPEYRQIRLLRLTPAAIAEVLPVSENELKEAYESRKEVYSTPEKRRVEQILVKDAETAQNLFKELTADNFAKVALEKANQDKETIDLGWIEKANVVEEIGEAVFNAKIGQVLPPVESQFGHHILIVREIEQAKQTPFNEVKDELKTAIQTEKAYDILVEKSKILDNALGEGQSIESAAKLIDMIPEKAVSVDASGKQANGTISDDLPAELVQKLFTLHVGESTPLYHYNGGYIVAELEGITPSTQQTFEQAKEVVTAEWMHDKQKKNVDAFVQEVYAEAKQDKSFASVAKKHNLETEDLNDISREAVQGVPVTAVADLFNAKENDVLLVPVDESNYVIVKVTKINSADMDDTIAVKLFNTVLTQQLADALYQQVLSYYEQDNVVEINQSLIQSTFEPYMKKSD